MTRLADDLLAALDAVELAARIGMNPDPWQIAVLRSADRRVLLACGRQTGKSTTAALMAVHQATFTPDSLVLMVAPTMRQSSELFRLAFTIYRTLGRPVVSEAENATSLRLENGSRIVSLPGDEKTVRGFAAASLIVLDEAARISDDLMAALEPMVAVSGGRLLALSTPWGRRGWFWEASLSPSWKVVVIPATACPRWAPADLDEFRRSHGELVYRSELLAEFVDGVGTVFRVDDIAYAFDSDDALALDLAPLFARDGFTPLPRHRPEVLVAGEG